MTDRKAIKVIQTFLMDRICILKQRDEEQAKLIDEAWKVVRRAALEAENRLSDEGTTTAWTNMPESPKDVFKGNVDESLNELNHGIMQCETDIQMLWNEIEKMKERMPKEWK